MKKKLILTPLFDNLSHFTPLTDTLPIEDLAQAETDYLYAYQFLHAYRGSEATFTAYRRDIERFLQWTWHVQQKSLKMLHRIDIEGFIEFCQKPPKQWIGTQNVARFIEKDGKRVGNPAWRPFIASVSKVAHLQGKTPDPNAYILSQPALQAIFAIIGSFYSYLVQEQYVDLNPVAQIRQKSKFLRKYHNMPTVRRLTEIQWAYVIATAETMATENPDQHERTLFIMNALYGMYLRISELATSKRWQPQMGHFHKDHDANWWFTTVGKGNKQRMITVSDAMLEALKRYRISLNLPPLPFLGENTPLLPKLRGSGAINSARQIRNIVQACFDRAIICLNQDHFSEEAEQLKAATVHWLRHTGISDDVKHRPREHVRDDAGHSSSAITDKYIDIELRARHASGRGKKIKPQEYNLDSTS